MKELSVACCVCAEVEWRVVSTLCVSKKVLDYTYLYEELVVMCLSGMK